MTSGPPNYTLIQQEMVDASGGEADIKFLARLHGPGQEFDGVIIGFRKFEAKHTSSGTLQIEVDHVIVSIPESLAEHKSDINNKIGPVNKRLAAEINKVTSIILAEIANEDLNGGNA